MNQINYEVNVFWNYGLLATLKFKESCLEMNFGLFITSGDFDLGDFDVLYIDFEDFDMLPRARPQFFKSLCHGTTV